LVRRLLIGAAVYRVPVDEAGLVWVDPFGHGIYFIQFLGRGYDEISHE
jgi:hypothetical protein